MHYHKKNSYYVHVFSFLLLGIFIQHIVCHDVKAQGNLYIYDPFKFDPTAQGNIHLGPVKVDPFFATSEAYDNNIFDTTSDKKSDLITVLTPGINLSSPIKSIKSEANFNYRANFLEYADHTDESHVDQYLAGSFKTMFPYGLGLTIKDIFYDTEQPPYFSLIYGEQVNRIRRHTNDFSATVALPEYFGRLEPEIYYSNYDIQYEDSTIISTQGTSTTTTKFNGKNSSYNTQIIGTRLTYKLFTKLNTLTEFNIGKTNYDTDVIGDSEFFESLFGVQFKETAKTTGIFKIGYRIRNYDNETFNQFNGMVLSYESRTQLTASTFLDILLRKSQEEALVTNTINNRNFYELNSIYLTIGRQLTSKITGNFSNYYQMINYPAVQSGQSDIKTFTFGFRPFINYKIQKWLTATLSVWYDNRSETSNSSDTNDLGWEKSVATFTLGATF